MSDFVHQKNSGLESPAVSRSSTRVQTDPKQEQVGNSAIQSELGLSSDPPDEFGLLAEDPTRQAVLLNKAIGNADMPAIYRILGGPGNAEVKVRFQGIYKQDVKSSIISRMSASDAQYAVAFATRGTIDLKSRVRAVTVDIFGTDEEKVFELLETATPQDLYALAQDQEVIGWLIDELSLSHFKRALSALRPYLVELSDAQKAELFAREVKAQGLATDQGPRLITKLKARKGIFNDDEAGMLTDVKAFAQAVGPQVVDGDKVNAEVKKVLDWLYGELSDREYLEAKNTIRAGGSDKRTLDDKISEAAANRNWLGFRDTDEEAIYTAIQGASQEERGKVNLNDHKAAFDKKEFERAQKQMVGPEGDGSEGFKLLLDAVSGMWVSDNGVFEALEKMNTADLVRVRNDSDLVATIHEGLSARNVQRFNGIVGWTPDESDQTVEEKGKALAASDERMVSRVEEAMNHWDVNDDKVFAAIMEWQAAGGVLENVSPHYSRASDALRRFFTNGYTVTYNNLMLALIGSHTVTYKDRLTHATDGLGTDDAAVDNAIKEVSDAELILSWSNLPTYKQKATSLKGDALLGFTESFVPDVGEDVMKMLEGDRWHTTDERGTLRDRLVAALNTEEGKKLAFTDFGYTTDSNALLKLQYRQAQQVYDDSRGGIMDPVFDAFSARGTESEWAYGDYQGHAEHTLQQKAGTEAHSKSLETTEEKRTEYLTSAKAYDAVKSSAASVASGIVAVVVGAVITFMSGGTAAPAAYALIAGISGSVAGEITKAAMMGGTYDHEQGAQDLAVAIGASLVAMPLGKASDALAKGIKPQAMGILGESLTKQYPNLVRGISGAGKGLLDTAIKDFPVDYVKETINTEGLLRQGLSGAVGVAQNTFKSASVGIVSAGLTAAIHDKEGMLTTLKNAGEWDKYSDELVRAGVIDVGVTFAATTILGGGMPSAKDMVGFMAKIVNTHRGAPLNAAAAELDASQTLAFFNDAPKEDLRKVHGIGPSTAQEIRGARSRSSFTSIDDVLAVKHFRDEVLNPAALLIRDAYLKEHTKVAASAGVKK